MLSCSAETSLYPLMGTFISSPFASMKKTLSLALKLLKLVRTMEVCQGPPSAKCGMIQSPVKTQTGRGLAPSEAWRTDCDDFRKDVWLFQSMGWTEDCDSEARARGSRQDAIAARV